MKAIEQYFHVVLFIMLYKVVLTFKSVDETLVCGHSKEVTEQYFHVAQVGSNRVFCTWDVQLTFAQVRLWNPSSPLLLYQVPQEVSRVLVWFFLVPPLARTFGYLPMLEEKEINFSI